MKKKFHKDMVDWKWVMQSFVFMLIGLLAAVFGILHNQHLASFNGGSVIGLTLLCINDEFKRAFR